MVFVISLPKVEFLLGRRPIFKDGSVTAVIDVDNDQESESRSWPSLQEFV